VDHRVEVASVLCRLAGFNEYQAARVPGYDSAVMEHFGRFRDHASVRLVSGLRRDRGIGYNAPIEAALLADEKTWAPRIPLNPWPSYLDSRWDEGSLRAFLGALGSFARDTAALTFFGGQQALFDEIARVHAQRFPGHPNLDWFAAHFRVPAGSVFRLVPGLLTGSNSYGMHYRFPDGHLEIVSVIAQPGRQPDQPLVIPDQALELIVHEFCHAFANPWVETNRAALADSGQKLFAVSGSTLKQQAYTSWPIMLYESVVRGATIRYLADHGKQALVDWCLEGDREKGFWWTGDVAEALKAGTAGGPPVLELNTKSVVAVFDAWSGNAAERIARKQAELAAEREAKLKLGPQILSLTPADGDTTVSPTVALLELRFDRPMSGAVSLYGDVPKVTGKPSWNAERTVLTIPVALAPGTRYVMQLNSATSDGGFASAAGEKLTPRAWTFTVRR
jgi:hypothetical protein